MMIPLDFFAYRLWPHNASITTGTKWRLIRRRNKEVGLR